MHQQGLLGDKTIPGDRSVFILRHIAQNFDGRKVILDLPQQVGKEDDEGEQSAEPDPRISQVACPETDPKTEKNRQAKNQRGMLVQNSHAGDQSEKQPQPRRAALGDAHGHGHTGHPKKRFKRIHGKKAVHGQVDGTEKDRGRGEHVSKPAPAEFAHHPGRQQNSGGSGKSREKAQRKERISEKPSRKPGDQRDERRLIDIAPGKVLSAGGVIEFISKITVAIGNEEVNRKRGHGKDSNERRGAYGPDARFDDPFRNRGVQCSVSGGELWIGPVKQAVFILPISHAGATMRLASPSMRRVRVTSASELGHSFDGWSLTWSCRERYFLTASQRKPAAPTSLQEHWPAQARRVRQ